MRTEREAVATPGPVFGFVDEAAMDRVAVDVLQFLCDVSYVQHGWTGCGRSLKSRSPAPGARGMTNKRKPAQAQRMTNAGGVASGCPIIAFSWRVWDSGCSVCFAMIR
jgi:hypothetical protein